MYNQNINRLLQLIVAASFNLFAFAQSSTTKDKWDETATKTYSKSYTLNNEKVSIENKFGKLIIDTWDKNEVKVDAEIFVGTDTKEYADMMLSKINIVDEKQGDEISFKTIMDKWDEDKTDKKGRNQQLRVDVTVHLPATAKLFASNSFGPLTIKDFKGEVDLISKFGSLETGKLANAKSVTVEFGKAYIESAANAKFVFKYSRIDVKKIEGSIKGNFDYCNSVDLSVDANVKSIDLKCSYTSTHLEIEKNASIDYTIITNNARASSSSAFTLTEEKKDNTSNKLYYNPNHKYSGSIGKSGGTQINIQSNFGNVRFI